MYEPPIKSDLETEAATPCSLHLNNRGGPMAVTRECVFHFPRATLKSPAPSAYACAYACACACAPVFVGGVLQCWYGRHLHVSKFKKSTFARASSPLV